MIRILCDEMTRTQQLSVLREKLDPIASDYLAQMASEGVLTFDGQHYGFGHESFFDYCFARAFVAKRESLVEFLVGSEQHLFRRAQVRQVLCYLRDADRQRYCKELRSFLTDPRVRFHLKDLALASVFNVPDPDDAEWDLLDQWLAVVVADFASGKTPSDKFASQVWQHFLTSLSWFHLATGRGVIAGWLASGNDGLINAAVNYLRFHQRHSGDRVAELLEPYIGKGGDWASRFRFLIQWADHGNSRRFFELFLKLIDDGTLDNARGPIAVNSTFWSMLHGLANTRPEWVPEVLTRWLRRRSSLIRRRNAIEGANAWSELFNHDEFAADHFRKAAAKAPAAFVEHVLPVVLEITDAAVSAGAKPPKPDAIWPLLIKSEHESADGACLHGLATALRALAASSSENVREVVRQLRLRETFISNFLLQNLYEAGARQFSDEAVSLLCDEPWRFHCGYSDNSYWVTKRLISAVVPNCSPVNRAKLEKEILGYSSEYEHTPEGYKLSGKACFELLSAVPREVRTRRAQTRYEELERKFRKPDDPPAGMHTYTVGSPIPAPAADRMTDDQWLKAIAKYSSAERPLRWEEPEKGGAWELAAMLRDFLVKEPERFARLSLKFPVGTNPAYMERTLDGLKGAAMPTELKLDVARKAYSESRESCGTAIADLLGSVDDLIPDDLHSHARLARH